MTEPRPGPVVLDRFGDDVDEVVLILNAQSLWWKHGFNDGDDPDLVMGPTDPSWHGYRLGPSREGEGWRDTLVLLVHRHLLPLLDPADRTRITVPDYGWGSHNPARVETLDGESWNAVHDEVPADMAARFAFIEVRLTRAQVVAAVEETCGWAVPR